MTKTIVNNHTDAIQKTPATNHDKINKNTIGNQQQPSQKTTERHLDMTKLTAIADEIKKIKEDIKEGMIEEVSSCLEQIIKSAQIQNIQSERRAKPWFDAECYKERQKILQQLRKLRSTKTSSNTEDYIQARRTYKTLLKKKQENFTEQEGQKIIELAEANPFAALHPRKPKLTQAIQMKEWETHFKDILNTENIAQAYNLTDTRSEDFNPNTSVDRLRTKTGYTQHTDVNTIGRLRHRESAILDSESIYKCL